MGLMFIYLSLILEFKVFKPHFQFWVQNNILYNIFSVIFVTNDILEILI